MTKRIDIIPAPEPLEAYARCALTQFLVLGPVWWRTLVMW